MTAHAYQADVGPHRGSRSDVLGLTSSNAGGTVTDVDIPVTAPPPEPPAGDRPARSQTCSG